MLHSILIPGPHYWIANEKSKNLGLNNIDRIIGNSLPESDHTWRHQCMRFLFNIFTICLLGFFTSTTVMNLSYAEFKKMF